MLLKDVEREIESLYLDGALAQRIMSIDIRENNNGTDIITWQCNMASMKITDLKLPTVLLIRLDTNDCVYDVELMENFKGSQGIPCSQKYLNRIVKKCLIGRSFLDDDEIYRNKLMFHCRHIYELVAGCMSFYRYCLQKNQKKSSLFEYTKAFVTDEGILIEDVYKINDLEYRINENIFILMSDIELQKDGNIRNLKEIKLTGEIYLNNEKLLNYDHYTHSLEGHKNTMLGLLRLFAVPYNNLKNILGLKRNFYFTNLEPTAKYGLFIQAVSLLLFKDNYNYFQFVLSGLQKNGDTPLCVGIASNVEELQHFYPEFELDDFI